MSILEEKGSAVIHFFVYNVTIQNILTILKLASFYKNWDHFIRIGIKSNEDIYSTVLHVVHVYCYTTAHALLLTVSSVVFFSSAW